MNQNTISLDSCVSKNYKKDNVQIKYWIFNWKALQVFFEKYQLQRFNILR